MSTSIGDDIFINNSGFPSICTLFMPPPPYKRIHSHKQILTPTISTRLDDTSGEEVLESDDDPLLHGLLTLADLHDSVSNPTLETRKTGHMRLLLTQTRGSYFFLLGLSAPSGLPTWVLRYSMFLVT